MGKGGQILEHEDPDSEMTEYVQCQEERNPMIDGTEGAIK